MALTVVNLNVFPWGAGLTVVDPIWNSITVPSGMTFSGAQNLASTTYNAVPSVASGGTVGTYNFVTQAVTQYVVAFFDGEQRSRTFYTDGTSVALPTFKYLQQFQYSDANEVGVGTLGVKGGGFRIALTPASNNLIDATSPMIFVVGPDAMIVFASTQFG